MITHIIAFSTKESMEKHIEQIGVEDEYRVTFIRSAPLLEEQEESYPNYFSFLYGDVVELHQMKNGEIAVGIYSKQSKMKFITADKVIFSSELLGVNKKLVSQYEVLWAAGVDIDEIELRPRINHKYETTVQGIYYLK